MSKLNCTIFKHMEMPMTNAQREYYSKELRDGLERLRVAPKVTAANLKETIAKLEFDIEAAEKRIKIWEGKR
jgi:hypothetical protein